MELNSWGEYLKTHSDCDCVSVFGVPHLLRLICEITPSVFMASPVDESVRRVGNERYDNQPGASRIRPNHPLYSRE